MSRRQPTRQLPGGIEAGRLQDLITFQLKTTTYDVNGSRNESWGVGFDDWGEAQRLSEQNARFIIRLRDPEPRPDTHRILYFGAIWTINNCVPDRKRSMLIIDSDFSNLIEVTHMQSTTTEYIDGVPVVRPQIP